MGTGVLEILLEHIFKLYLGDNEVYLYRRNIGFSRGGPSSLPTGAQIVPYIVNGYSGWVRSIWVY